MTRRLAATLEGAGCADLHVLFRGRAVEELFLNLYVAVVSASADAPAAVKNKAVKAALGELVGAVAVRCARRHSMRSGHSCGMMRRYNQLVPVSTALLQLLNKHETLAVRTPVHST